MDKINNIGYYFILVLMLILCYVFYHSYFLWLLILIMAILPIMSIIMEKVAAGSITYELFTKETVVRKNTETIIWIIVKNRSIFPILSCSIAVDMKNHYYDKIDTRIINCSVAGLSAKKIGISIVPKYSGQITVNISSAVIRDMMNIVSNTNKENVSRLLTVLPENIEIDNLIDLNGIGESDIISDRKGYNGNEVVDIREYHPGDKLQKIHWKLSTKKDDLLVKEDGESLENSIILLCELFDGGEGILDKLLDTAYSISKNIIENGQNCILCYRNSGNEQLTKAEISDNESLMTAVNEMLSAYASDMPNNGYMGYMREFNALGGIIYIAPENVKDNIHGSVLVNTKNGVVVMTL